MPVGECLDCGKQKELEAEPPFAGICFACEVEQRLRLPPEELVDMRTIYNGVAPLSPGQHVLKRLFDQNLKEFMRLKKEAESSYRESMAKMKSEEGKAAAAVPEEKADEGTGKVLELIDQWLQEWGRPT